MVTGVNNNNNNSQSMSNSSSNTYTVRSGDTLSEIAARNKVSLSSVISANPQIKNPNLIYPGQQINMPSQGGTGNLAGLYVAKAQSPAESPMAGGNYMVRPGDTLSGIASRSGVGLNDMMVANPQIKNPNMIYVGQQLNIPGGIDGVSRPSSSSTQNRPTANNGANGASNSAPVRNTGPSGDVKGGVSVAELRRIMPSLSESKAQAYLPSLNRAMAEFKINTPERQAAFLAQLAQESGELKYFQEIASGAAYEGRRDLGNTQPGDGVRFKGRGPIQLTGRANYRSAGAALGIDLERNPARAADPDVGFRVAGWYWNSRNLNSFADSRNFDAITYRINGGYNGKSVRDMYYRRALGVLGA